MASSVPDASSTPRPLRELALLFLRLGTTAFGGPAAHIGMMQQEVVTKRQWLTNVEFLDMLAATNFIPGPNSTEMAIHIGYRRGGWRGLLVAGACFILPAALLCTLIAVLYVAWGQNPVSTSILYGVKPVVIAVIGQALFGLARSALKSLVLVLVVPVSIGLLLASVNELVVLFGAGVLVACIARTRRKPLANGTLPVLAMPTWLLGQSTTTAVAATASVSGAPLGMLFLIFLKIGSVLFGSGYVLLAFLQADLVDRYHWLTQNQLLDAIAVGQVTPGPLFTTATFIGYVTAGPWGALLATLGIFLPAFFFVAVSAPLLPKLRQSPTAAAFLDGLNVASLALMAVVSFDLARTALIDPLTIGLTAASLLLLIWKNLNSVWLVLAGAVVGIIHGYIV